MIDNKKIKVMVARGNHLGNLNIKKRLLLGEFDDGI